MFTISCIGFEAMNKVPQVITRSIGDVSIIELKGELIGPWALRAKDEIARFIQHRACSNLLITLGGLETIDSLGVKAIIENLEPKMRVGVVVGNLGVMEMFARVKAAGDLKFFKTEEEVVHYFGRDLVNLDEAIDDDRRKHQRLRTAFPLEFSFDNDAGQKVFFHAVVTDLSEGGLLAEYLDLDQASFGSDLIEPNDDETVDLRLKVPGSKEIVTRGKVVRTLSKADQVGLGIEFCNLAEEDRGLILESLK